VQSGTDPAGAAFLQRLAGVTSCGSSRNGSTVSSSSAADDLVSSVFLGPAPLPAVAAGPPCSERIVLRDIHFEFDSDGITGQGNDRIDAAIAEMNACPGLPFQIEGHTDSMGSEAYNEGLSLRRAEAVRRYLIRGGIDASRLDVQGVGEARPLADNDTAEGRAQNRRVALVPER
jgi:outer membrane protein OmpA-like peptidoglycan-associated protein